MDGFTVKQKIYALLKNNLTDPLGRATEWIYIRPPRYDPQVPFIVIFHKGTKEDGLAIGLPPRQLETHLIHIVVYSTRDTKAVCDDGIEREGEELVDYLVEQIKAVLQNNQTSLAAEGLIYSLVDEITKTLGDTYVLADVYLLVKTVK